MVALARRYAFGEVAALVAGGAGGEHLTTRQAAQVQQLCAFGQRLLDLDAEDFGRVDATVGASTDTSVADLVSGDAVPSPLTRRARASRMPRSTDERPAGALDSLVPAYRLLLEVIAARWARRETAALVAAVHITSEYAPLLAWEPVLGHAGDPRRLLPFVTVPGSRFGRRDPDCAHNKADQAGAARLLRLTRGGDLSDYLDRQHSNVAHALGVCAGDCAAPCAVMRQVPDADDLPARARLALAYADTEFVRLRHAAPVGHGFGVPSPAEVMDAWQRSREKLGGPARRDDGFPLPGLASLFGHLAGTPIEPDTLLADTAATLVRALSGAAGAPVVPADGATVVTLPAP
nr:hypothetical protein [Planosporangium mesophilum]